MNLDNLAYFSLVINTTCVVSLCSYGIYRFCRKTFGFIQQKSQQFNQLCLDISNISTEFGTMNTELQHVANHISSCLNSLHGIEDNGSSTKIANTLAIGKDYCFLLERLASLLIFLFGNYNPINYVKEWFGLSMFKSQTQPARSPVLDEFRILLNTKLAGAFQEVTNATQAKTPTTETPIKSNINITRTDPVPEKIDDLTVVKPLCHCHKETEVITTTTNQNTDKSVTADKSVATDKSTSATGNEETSKVPTQIK